MNRAVRAASTSLLALLALPLAVCATLIDYPVWPGVVVVKIAPDYVPQDVPHVFDRTGFTSIDNFLNEIGATRVELKFPYTLPPKPGGADITRYYNVFFPESLPVPDVCRDFAKVEGIETAEPWQIDYLLLDHNDPFRNNQYALNLTQANAAHDISTGSRVAPIAIVDTGVFLAHSDLNRNLWINPGEDLDGNGVIDANDRNQRDDDRNGRTDDFYGWDFMGPDNDPNDVDGHGTHCAGDASAVTNNRVGIASIGYSCAIMAVRSGAGQTIQYGYEGVDYAVRNGAKVISCSWGGYGGNQWTEQVMQSALDNDVLVICAAGNDNRDRLHYPSAYESVVAVAATNSNDGKAGFSNYGDWVDVSAPGVDILSTVPGNQYAYYSGTSMACPIAAGLAVLLRSTYTEMTALEIRAILLQGADNIDNNLDQFAGQMGSGRINAFRSLELGNRPMLSVDSIEVIRDNNDNGLFDPGEEIELAVVLSNSAHGQATDSVRVFLESDDADINFEDNQMEFPNLEPGDVYTNSETPFNIRINAEAYPRTTWMTVSVTAYPGNLTISRTFEVLIGHPPILIVDDDDGFDTEEYYKESIEALNKGWVNWSVATRDQPDVSTLTDYDMVIWSTGEASPPLDELDRYQIEGALMDGAHILLVGNRIGDSPDSTDVRGFLRTNFGVRFEEDSVGVYTVEGLSGDRPLGRDIQMTLAGGGGANEDRASPSTMSPVLGADSLVVYKIGQRVTGLAGVYREDPRTHSKTAFLGFAFECVSNVRTPRSTVIDRLYNWFIDENSVEPETNTVPQLVSLDAAYPNPFNGMMVLKYTVPAGLHYQLGIYDTFGREAASAAAGIGTDSPITSAWNAGSLPTGTYFARLTVGGNAFVERRVVLVK
jgi:hypothetical protein